MLKLLTKNEAIWVKEGDDSQIPPYEDGRLRLQGAEGDATACG